MSRRRITQETFDDAVKENMEEFEMEPAEALRDAVEQFESQGNVRGAVLTLFYNTGCNSFTYFHGCRCRPYVYS